MKTLQLNKIKYDVPTSWDEVTLGMQISVTDDADKISGSTALKKIAMLSGYAKIPLQELKNTRMDKITKLFHHLQFLSTPLPTTPITTFDFKGDTYHVIETLMNSQFQDYVSLETAVSDNKEHQHRALPIILAIMCKKEGETLDDYDVMERAKEFEDLPMSIVEPLRVFFWGVGITSQLHSLSSTMEGKELLVNAKANVLVTTLSQQDGLAWHRKLLSSILLRWTKFLHRKSQRFFRSIQSKS